MNVAFEWSLAVEGWSLRWPLPLEYEARGETSGQVEGPFGLTLACVRLFGRWHFYLHGTESGVVHIVNGIGQA